MDGSSSRCASSPLPNSKCDKGGRTILEEHRQVWSRKPALRAIYRHWYGEMLSGLALSRYPTVELGGGTGNLKEFSQTIITSDIIPCNWLDIVFDAHCLPFKQGSVGNLIMFDVLHHLVNPRLFFQECVRVLDDGGRIVMLEPFISPFSWLCYSCFHQENVSGRVNPLEMSGQASPHGSPFDGNSAVPGLIFGKYRNDFQQQFPNLRIRAFRRLSLFAYPLSGGFKPWSLLPVRWVSAANRIENFLTPLLPLMAFRCLVVLEKTSPSPSGSHRGPSDEAPLVQSVPLK